MLTPCRKCLFSQMDDLSMYRQIEDYLAAMDPALKAPPARYRARLDRCRACEHLVSGTCQKCGCFVEVRCAKARQTCPDVPPRWG